MKPGGQPFSQRDRESGGLACVAENHIGVCTDQPLWETFRSHQVIDKFVPYLKGQGSNFRGENLFSQDLEYTHKTVSHHIG